MLICPRSQQYHFIYKAVWGHFSVSCTPLKCLDDLCASVYTRTATVSASRLFDYEWSMPLQQNAQRPDTEQRANSSLACLAWFSSMAGSSVSQTAACLPASLYRAEPRPGGGQGPGPVRTGPAAPHLLEVLKQNTPTATATSSLYRPFTALTSSPAVQVAAHPRHPDLEQRSLCQFPLFYGSVDGQSHEAGADGGADERPRCSANCLNVCTAVNSAFCRSADCC